MIRKNFIFVLTLGLTIFIAGVAFGQNCSDIVGDWDLTIEWVYYDDVDDSYGYTTYNGIIHIVDQNGCLFYGYVEFPDDPESDGPLTGIITKRRFITASGCDTILNGMLSGYNYSSKMFTIMKLKLSNLNVKTPDTWQGNGLATATRR